MSIYEFSVRKLNGETVQLSAFKGKVLLIVNTASECGLTPQYKELQQLYDLYQDQGLVILGFPCNQFGGQEPGTAEEITNFCSLNYQVTFPMFEKIDVKGPNADPIYRYLTEQTGGEIGWNFTKFLVDKEGQSVVQYDFKMNPLELQSDIKKLLAL